MINIKPNYKPSGQIALNQEQENEVPPTPVFSQMFRKDSQISEAKEYKLESDIKEENKDESEESDFKIKLILGDEDDEPIILDAASSSHKSMSNISLNIKKSLPSDNGDQQMLKSSRKESHEEREQSERNIRSEPMKSDKQSSEKPLSRKKSSEKSLKRSIYAHPSSVKPMSQNDEDEMSDTGMIQINMDEIMGNDEEENQEELQDQDQDQNIPETPQLKSDQPAEEEKSSEKDSENIDLKFTFDLNLNDEFEVEPEPVEESKSISESKAKPKKKKKQKKDVDSTSQSKKAKKKKKKKEVVHEQQDSPKPESQNGKIRKLNECRCS